MKIVLLGGRLSTCLREKPYLICHSLNSKELLNLNPSLSLTDSIKEKNNWHSEFYACNEQRNTSKIFMYLKILARQESTF
jgi:hypothetical protein